MTSAGNRSIAQRKETIYNLEQTLRQESVRIVRAGERVLSDKYTNTDKELKQEKAEYELSVGRPYTPPEPKPSQVDSTLFIKRRARTTSDDSLSSTFEAKLP